MELQFHSIHFHGASAFVQIKEQFELWRFELWSFHCILFRLTRFFFYKLGIKFFNYMCNTLM